MTDPSQYFRGRTVQEQMNEVIGYVDVRSAEVATDAIASDVAQVHSDAADAHADALAAAASAAAAAGTLTNAVKKTGEASQSIDGDIDLNDDLNVDGDATVGGALAVTGAVTVPAPVNNTDAATKKYVDDADALKMNITDVNSYAVGLTGNQDFAGQKRATTQNGLSMRTLSNSGNNFEIGSTGLYNHLRMRNYKSDGTGFDDHAQIGTDYATASTCVGRVLFYAPRVNKGDTTEGQTTAGITFSVNNDDTVTIRLTVYKRDGTNVSKTLATFDGSNWS